MSIRSIGLTDDVHRYLLDNSSRPTPVQLRLIERTSALGDAGQMQISPEQGLFLTSLVTLLQPKLIVEVGTFTGYSSLSMALGLPDDGRLIACDVSEEWTAVAREFWAEAGVADKVDLRIGPGAETLAALPESPMIDMAFIDADKGGYLNYYEAILSRLSDRGFILVDNTLWSGRVADPTEYDDETEAIRSFNAHVAADIRTEAVILPIGDGLTLVRRAG